MKKTNKHNKSCFKIYPILILLLFISHIKEGRTATLGTVTVTSEPKEVSSTGDLFLLTFLISDIPNDGSIEIVIPDSTSIQQGNVPCSFSEPSDYPITCQAAGRMITVALPDGLSGFFQLDVSGFTNPPSTTPTDSFTLVTKRPDNTVIDEKLTNIVLTATTGTLTSLNLVSDSQRVGEQTNMEFTMTLKHEVPRGGVIKIQFPKWNPNAPENQILSMIQSAYSCQGLDNISASLICTFSNDILRIQNGFNDSPAAANTVIRLKVVGVKNPITTSVVGGIWVTTEDSIGGEIDRMEAQIQVSQPSVITFATLTTDNKIVQELGEVKLVFNTPVPLDEGCLIDIIFPTQIPISSIELQRVEGLMLFGAKRVLTGSINQASNTYRILDGCDVYKSTDLSAITYFQSIRNPLSVQQTDSFKIQIRDSTQSLIAELSSGVYMNAQSGTFQITSLTAENRVINSVTNVKFRLQPQHKLPLESKLLVRLSAQFTLPNKDETQCLLLEKRVLQTNAKCIIQDRRVIILDPFDTPYDPFVVGEIEFTIGDIKMPSTASPTGEYEFTSLIIASNGSDYQVDETLPEDLIRAIPDQITSAQALPDQTITYTLSTYTFSFKAKNDIAREGKVVIQLPPQITIPDFAITANSCQKIAGFEESIQCVISDGGRKIVVNDGFKQQSLIAGDQLSLSVDGLLNPVSTQPSDSFAIHTQTRDSYGIDSITSGIVVTMNQVLGMSNVGVAPQSLVNGAITDYKFRFIPSSYLISGDYAKITFPSTLSLPTIPICKGVILLSQILDCVKIGSSQLFIKLEIPSNLSQINSGEIFEVEVRNIKNPPTTQPTDPFSFELTNKNNFEINDYLPEVNIATTKAATMLDYSISQSSQEAAKQISVSIFFKPIHSIPALSQIFIQYPQLNSINLSEFSCDVNLAPGATCQVVSQIDRKIKVSGAFVSQYNAPGDFIEVTLHGVNNAMFAAESTSFKVELQTEQNYKIDQIGIGLVLVVDCDYPCLSCTATDKGQCMSCIPSSTANKLQDFSCVENCASNRILQGNECQKCDDKCLTCENTPTQCSSCGGDLFPYLSGTFCVNQCPHGFYNDPNQNKCLACESPCDSCEQQPTKCTSCRQNQDLKFLYGNSCNRECPIGISLPNGLICESCNPNCLECQNSIDECASCTQTQRLDSKNQVCLNECPAGITIEINKICEHCDPNCLTCAKTIDTCTSCGNNLVLTNQNTCRPTCESENREIPIAGKCERCKSPCLTCIGDLEECLTCTPDFYLYEGECLDRCPERYGANDSGVCILEGLKCPLGYIVNETGDGCTPTVFNCPEGQELNEDNTECRPIGGSIVPFPFLFVILLFLLITIASLVKDPHRTKFATSLIAQISLLELAMYLLQIVLCIVNKQYVPMMFTMLAFGLLILANIAYFVFFRRYTQNDIDYMQWSKQYHKTTKILPALALILNFKTFKFFYSGFFGLDTCQIMISDAEKNFLKPMRFVTIFQFIFIYSSIIIADFIILADVEWGHQLLIIGIETLITSILLIILIIIEWIRSKKSALIGQAEIYMKLRAEPDIRLQSGAPYGAEGVMDEDYDTQLRKRALLSIIRQVKKPAFPNNHIDNCHFDVDKSSLRRTESCVEFYELKREFDEDSDATPERKRRNSYELDSKTLQEYQGKQNIFQHLIQKVLQSQADILENNVYADSKPLTHIAAIRQKKKVTRSTQTYLREIMALEDETQHSDLEIIIEDEAELDPDYARELIDVVIDGLADSDANMQSLRTSIKKGQLNARRLQEIPDFELADIMGEFEIDDMGNFIILCGESGHLLDKHDKKVNRRGYLVDKYGNVVNKQSVIIFRQNELDSDDEIPAPFGFEKRRKQILNQDAEKKARFQDQGEEEVFVNDEELVESEIRKLTGAKGRGKGVDLQAESSVETLMGETPSKYNKIHQQENDADGTSTGQEWKTGDGNKDLKEIKKPKVKKSREKFRKDITNQDKTLANAYNGVPRGQMQNTMERSTVSQGGKRKNHEIMPSFDRDVQSKLFKLAGHIQSQTLPKEVDESMRKEELKQRLEELKSEHFNELQGISHANVFDSPINYQQEDDQITERKYDTNSRQNAQNLMSNINQTESQFGRHPNSFYPSGQGPLDSSIGGYPGAFRDESLMGSRMTNRPRKEGSQLAGTSIKKNRGFDKHMSSNSKISRIYSNQVASVQGNYEEMYSPIGMSHDAENASIQRFIPKHKKSVMSSVYQQDLAAQRKASQQQQIKRKAPKFRQMHNRLIDDPEFLLEDDDPNQAERDLIAFKISGQLDRMRQTAWSNSAQQFY